MQFGLLILIAQMKSDSEIFEILKFTEYGKDFHDKGESLCLEAIPRINGLDILDELVEHCYYHSQFAFRLTLKRIIELENQKQKKICA